MHSAPQHGHGHRCHPGLSIERAHTIAHAAEHELTHAVPRLTAATVHAHPARSLVSR